MQPSPDGGLYIITMPWKHATGTALQVSILPHPPPTRAALTAVSSCQVLTPEIAKQTPSAIISRNIHMIQTNHERTAAHLKVFNRNDFCQTPD